MRFNRSSFLQKQAPSQSLIRNTLNKLFSHHLFYHDNSRNNRTILKNIIAELRVLLKDNVNQ